MLSNKIYLPVELHNTVQCNNQHGNHLLQSGRSYLCTISDVMLHTVYMFPDRRGGIASFYSYVTSCADICYDNQS